MRIRPLNKHVVAAPYEPPKQGGLLLPDEKFKNHYVVEEVGPDVTGIESGNLIFVDKYFPIEIEADGERRVLIHLDKILAVFETC
jgi:co-chaperonin GroES (HSP10)